MEVHELDSAVAREALPSAAVHEAPQLGPGD